MAKAVVQQVPICTFLQKGAPRHGLVDMQVDQPLLAGSMLVMDVTLARVSMRGVWDFVDLGKPV